MKQNIQTAVVALLSAATGALLVVLLIDNAPSPAAATGNPASDVDTLLDRVAALEQRLIDTGESTGLQVQSPPPLAVAGDPPSDDAVTRARAMQESQIEEMRRRRSERVSTRLREAGWSDAEIEALEELRDTLGLELERRQYEAMRQAMLESPETSSVWQSRQSVMREALGDARYEQYLEANGRPVAIEVDNVLAGSAGEAAGLRPGDKIRRYGAQRVYDERDLMFAVLDGEPGEGVSVEVERDGAVFYVTVPRGPLGTSRMSRMGYDF